MTDLLIQVKIYDPAVPFKRFSIENSGIEPWYQDILITKKARSLISQVPELRKQSLVLPGGMSMVVPVIEIGVQVGSVRIDNLEALVLDEGTHDILLGRKILERSLTVGAASEPETRITSASKDDSRALALELYPLQTPVELRLLENVIKYQRRLHNIFLIAQNEISQPAVNELNDVIRADYSIPENLRLKLSWIDSGSIWLSLVSGSANALKYLASFFEKGASAKLAQQIAEADQAQSQAQISQETRNSIATRIKEEQEMLRAENLGKAYEAWRTEIMANLNFSDDLISQINNKELAEALRLEKDKAIIEILKQQILPIVRNVPRPFELDSDRPLLLPPSSSDD